MKSIKMRWGVAAVTALALFAAGCGSSSDDNGAGGNGEESSSQPSSPETTSESQTASSAGGPAGSSMSGSSMPGSSMSGSSGTGSAGGGLIAGQYDLSGVNLTVGSKEFTESKVLGRITIQALQAAGANVADKIGISGTDTVRAALTSGEVDMYWEYTGTGWVNILKHSTEDLPDDLFAAVADEDAANGVSWLPMAPFSDTYAIAAKADWAQQNNITTLSDAAAFIQDNPDQATLCAASEFINRDDGLPGLEDAYGITFDVTELDLNLVYPQVGNQCNFGEVFSTDARIVSNDLQVLDDDKGFFVPYNGALTVRSDVLDANPAIAKIMAPISALLTNETVTNMNAAVDVDGKDAKDVATEFLTTNGFIS